MFLEECWKKRLFRLLSPYSISSLFPHGGDRSRQDELRGGGYPRRDLNFEQLDVTTIVSYCFHESRDGSKYFASLSSLPRCFFAYDIYILVYAIDTHIYVTFMYLWYLYIHNYICHIYLFVYLFMYTFWVYDMPCPALLNCPAWCVQG